MSKPAQYPYLARCTYRCGHPEEVVYVEEHPLQYGRLRHLILPYMPKLAMTDAIAFSLERCEACARHFLQIDSLNGIGLEEKVNDKELNRIMVRMGKREETTGRRGGERWRWRTKTRDGAGKGSRDGFMDALENFRCGGEVTDEEPEDKSCHAVHGEGGRVGSESTTIISPGGDRRYNRAARVYGTADDVQRIEEESSPVSLLQMRMKVERTGLGIIQQEVALFEDQAAANLPSWGHNWTADGLDTSFSIRGSSGLVPAPLQTKKKGKRGGPSQTKTQTSTPNPTDGVENASGCDLAGLNQRLASEVLIMAPSHSTGTGTPRPNLQKQLPELPTDVKRKHGLEEKDEISIRSRDSKDSTVQMGKAKNAWVRGVGLVRSFRRKGLRDSTESSRSGGTLESLEARYSAEHRSVTKTRNSVTTAKSAEARLMQTSA